MFQVSLTTSNQPVSLYVGDIPMVAGNKTVNLETDDMVESNSIDRLPAGTDGPYIPSLLKLFHHYSGMLVQDPGQIGGGGGDGDDIGWTALVLGVRGFPPTNVSTEITASSSPETKIKDKDKDKDNHRSENKETNGRKNYDDVTKKFMSKNQSLTFVPTVCVVRCTGLRTDSRNIDFDCDFKNWIDADFWGNRKGKRLHFYFLSHLSFIFSTFFVSFEVSLVEFSEYFK